MGMKDKLIYLYKTKGEIKDAIKEKGVDVTNADTFRKYADKIRAINTIQEGDEGKVVVEGELTEQTTRTITVNGSYDTTTNNRANVNVPNSYTEEDEGKVVKNGLLSDQGSIEITENGTYDTTYINELSADIHTNEPPVRIEVCRMPNVLEYDEVPEPEDIDLTGIAVAAYRADCSLWTDEDYIGGRIPVEELSAEFHSEQTPEIVDSKTFTNQWGVLTIYNCYSDTEAIPYYYTGLGGYYWPNIVIVGSIPQNSVSFSWTPYSDANWNQTVSPISCIDTYESTYGGNIDLNGSYIENIGNLPIDSMSAIDIGYISKHGDHIIVSWESPEGDELQTKYYVNPGYRPDKITIPAANLGDENYFIQSDEGKVVSSGNLITQTSKNINANGTVDTTTNNSVVVNVPNSYAASDEGKVVNNGALTAQSSQSVTQNGTYDTTLKNQVVVNVEGGSATLVSKTITANGTYDPADDNADGYDEVIVNVSGGGSSDIDTSLLPNSDSTKVLVSQSADMFDENKPNVWGRTAVAPSFVNSNADTIYVGDNELAIRQKRSFLYDFGVINKDVTIYAIAKVYQSVSGLRAIISLYYASSGGNEITFYTNGTILMLATFGNDYNPNVSMSNYHMLAMSVNQTTKKVRYFIDGNYITELPFSNSGRALFANGSAYSSNNDIAFRYLGVVDEVESDEDIIANSQYLMQEFDVGE